MSHPVQCKCGKLKGEISGTGTSNRVVCYCTGCRAFARFLATAPDILDQQGGTEIIQVAQPRLCLTAGGEHLAAVQFSGEKAIRWYASCCETPLGNTAINAKLAFIGLIHPCLQQDQIEQDFGHSVAKVFTDTALGEPKPKQQGMFGVYMRMGWILLSNLIGGGYRKSILFDAGGKPCVAPRILSRGEVAELKAMDATPRGEQH